MTEFMNHLPDSELDRVLQETEGGAYTEARLLALQEKNRREIALQAMRSVDMPYLVPEDPMDNLQCESCQ